MDLSIDKSGGWNSLQPIDSKFEAMDSLDEQNFSNHTINDLTFCSSEKRMQTIARRVLGKDRQQNHSLQSASKTSEGTPIRGQLRI